MTDYRELPGKVDAAVVALPNHLHAPVSVELLRQGVSVLVEKPMAINVRECDEMIAAAAAGRATLAVGLDFRFFDSSLLVRNLLRDGLLGAIRSFDLRQGVIPRWPFATDFLLRKEMAGGGVLADFGVHVLDLLLWWLGDWTAVDYRDDAVGGVESDCEMELTLGSGRLEIPARSRSAAPATSATPASSRGSGRPSRPASGTPTPRSASRSPTARSPSPATRGGTKRQRASTSPTSSCARSTTSRPPSAPAASRSSPAPRGAARWR